MTVHSNNHLIFDKDDTDEDPVSSSNGTRKIGCPHLEE